jgi:hypothetical protein
MDYWSIIELLIISDQLNVLGVTGYCILGGNLIKLSPCLRLSFPRDDHQTLTIRPVACAQLQGEAWKKYQRGPAFARSYQDTGAGHWNMRQLAMVTRLFSIFFLIQGGHGPCWPHNEASPFKLPQQQQKFLFLLCTMSNKSWASRYGCGLASGDEVPFGRSVPSSTETTHSCQVRTASKYLYVRDTRIFISLDLRRVQQGNIYSCLYSFRKSDLLCLILSLHPDLA